jgi:formylglycine-generating enzyme required for sulfatase activity
VREALVADLAGLQRVHHLRPDLIFFTGDAAFGHLGAKPGESIAAQFKEAAGFLDSVRRAFVPEVPCGDLFLVPGNHDVDRRHVSPSLTKWLDDQRDLAPVLRLIQEAGVDWRVAMKRLGPFLELLRSRDLGHLLQDPKRAIWATLREIGGLRVGIAGFNSAWSCGRDREKGRLWAAGHWQQGRLREKLREADLRIALMHHPPDWLVPLESPDFFRGLRQDFRFLLHGHEHKDWVESGDDGFTTIAAGACYDRSDKENGYNMVRLDTASGSGEVWLRKYDATGGGWVARTIHGLTDNRGVRPLRFARQRDLAVAGGGLLRRQREPLRLLPEPDAPDPELARYLERLRSANRDLPVVGFATRLRFPIELESVYVPLRARVVEHSQETEPKQPGAYREPTWEAGKDREVAFDEALRLALRHGFHGAVVLGDPGTGKTTLLKHLLLAATDPTAGPGRLGLPPQTVPVLIELRSLRDPAAGLRAAVTEAVERTDPSLDAAGFALELLRRDHLLVLADGLDEIADPTQRAEVSRWIEEVVSILPRSTFVVTSRYAGYQEDARLSSRFLELHVRELVEHEARRFIHGWYGAVEARAELGRAPELAARLAEEAAGELAGRIFDREDPRTASLTELATNPLMLQILCLVHRDRKHLPERRVELYGECCLVLLELWRRAKGMAVSLTAAQAQRLLQPLAHWLHANQRKEATAEEIQPLLATPLRDLGRSPADAETFLAAIRDQSGILVNVGSSYTFLHLSFQEYLCARHLQDQVVRAPELLVDLATHFGETWWREVILLVVGLDNPGLFEPLMDAILRHESLHRDVRLADDCLRDASTATPRPLLRALAQGLENTDERYHALRLLRSLPGWEAEALTDGVAGRDLVERLAGDRDQQVRRMALELLGIETAAANAANQPIGKRRTARRGGPFPGEERFNEIDGSVLLYVPGGELDLGADGATAGEKRAHRVVLSPFWIGKYPVTNEQFGRFWTVNPGAAPPRYREDKQFNQPNQPVVGVSWGEAQAYCRWTGLRLPSEAQWEAAARGGDRRRYPWGDEDPAPEHANFGWREGRTTPVGAFPRGAGAFGTLDQAGNVWEWCEDVWSIEASWMKDGGAMDPVGSHGNAAVRCLRGGSWNSQAGYLPAAVRFGSWASVRDWDFGFRCVLPALPEP